MTSKLFPFLLILCGAVLPAQAGPIYKTVDANGNTVYTDSPPANQKSEEVDLPSITPLQIQTPQHYYQPPARKQNEPKADYSSLKIITPLSGTTIRNTGDVAVAAKMDTGLLSNHRFQLFLDGKKYGKKQRNSSFKLTGLDRGTHILEVAVVNGKGKKLESTSSTVHIQKAIYRPPVTTKPAP